MRRRRKTRSEATSLDGFLDVVCNLVAGLLLIALITSLAARNKVFDVVVPVEQQSVMKRPVDFVITKDGVYPLDPTKAIPKLKANATVDGRGGERSSAETDYFYWSLSSSPSLLFCRLKNLPPPINDRNVSVIVDRMNTMKGKNHFAFFFVSPQDEAFRLFRLARKELWDNDFKVGWTPSDPKYGIAFGTGGRPIQPQE